MRKILYRRYLSSSRKISACPDNDIEEFKIKVAGLIAKHTWQVLEMNIKDKDLLVSYIDKDVLRNPGLNLDADILIVPVSVLLLSPSHEVQLNIQIWDIKAAELIWEGTVYQYLSDYEEDEYGGRINIWEKQCDLAIEVLFSEIEYIFNSYL